MGLSDERTLTTRPFFISVTTLQAMSQLAQRARFVVTPSRTGRSEYVASMMSCGSNGTGAGMTTVTP
jgi:hypothetical protein